MNWTKTLPTKEGYYFFRDIDTDLEEGVGYVYSGHRRAEILIPLSFIDGAEPYISSIHWAEHEVFTDIWEWLGPMDCPL